MMDQPERRTLRSTSESAWILCVAFMMLVVGPLAFGSFASAAEDGQYKTAGGLAVYVGVVPAEITKGRPSHLPEPPMHGRVPRGSHEYHVIAAIFDAATGVRISDATVTAQVSGLALSGPQKTLEPMKIADTITYGGFIDLPGTDLYTIRLMIRRPSLQQPVVLEFKYDHRRQ